MWNIQQRGLWAIGSCGGTVCVPAPPTTFSQSVVLGTACGEPCSPSPSEADAHARPQRIRARHVAIRSSMCHRFSTAAMPRSP